MNTSVTLATHLDGADLKVYLQRAERLGCEHVHLIAMGPAVVPYVAVLTPAGLLDQAPTVLGVRVFARHVDPVSETGTVDTVVQVRAVLDRLAHDQQNIPLPIPQPGVPWAGVTPPQADWQVVGLIPVSQLATIATAGIAEVAAANGLGTNIVQTVRQEVWGRPIVDAPSGVPAGAAFAALGLGFLGTEKDALVSDELAQVSTSGAWARLSTERGHVLVK